MNENRFGLIAGGVALISLVGVTIATIIYRESKKTYKRKFDPEAVEELSGKVVDIVYSGLENRENMGVELMLKSGEEFNSVHLGPAWFIDRQNGKIKQGEKIKIRGSRVIHNHDPVIVAEIVKKGDKVFRLRDETGHPVWSAWVE